MDLFSVTLLLQLFYCLLSMRVFFFVCLFFLHCYFSFWVLSLWDSPDYPPMRVWQALKGQLKGEGPRCCKSQIILRLEIMQLIQSTTQWPLTILNPHTFYFMFIYYPLQRIKSELIGKLNAGHYQGLTSISPCFVLNLMSMYYFGGLMIWINIRHNMCTYLCEHDSPFV